jgi:hypothetical protein
MSPDLTLRREVRAFAPGNSAPPVRRPFSKRSGTEVTSVQRSALIAGVLLCVAVTSLGAQPLEYQVPHGAGKFARIVYPASGVVDTTEGSIELWVCNEFDPGVKLGNLFYPPAAYAVVAEPDGSDQRLHILTRSVTNGRDMGYILGKSMSFISVTDPARFGWSKPGEWHSVAFTWKLEGARYTLSMYQDGRLVSRESDTATVIPTIGPETELAVGSTGEGPAFITVDEVRVSAVARTPEEIAAAFASREAFQWDALTVLLDHCDAQPVPPAGSCTYTTADGVRGRVLGAAQSVDGRFGKALRLHAIEEVLPR